MYWHKQGETALFAELEWDKPERRDQAGKICIVGGHIHNLNAPAKAYETIKESGPSAIRIVLPDKTRSLIGKVLPEAAYLRSTKSGEFSREGLADLVEHLAWTDTLLLPGDVGRNSETTMLLEDVLTAFNGQVVLTKDALDTLITHPQTLLNRPRTTIVASFAQLQKLVKNSGSAQAIQFSIDLVKLVDFLHSFTEQHQIAIITLHDSQFVVAVNGEVSTTKLLPDSNPEIHWRVAAAGIAACYQTWYSNKPFEALTQVVANLRSLVRA